MVSLSVHESPSDLCVQPPELPCVWDQGLSRCLCSSVLARAGIPVALNPVGSSDHINTYGFLLCVLLVSWMWPLCHHGHQVSEGPTDAWL